MNYYKQTGFVSNSNLSALKKLLFLIQDRDASEYYNFGNLTDALLTEPDKVDIEAGELAEESSEQTIRFNREQIERAVNMVNSAVAGAPFIKQLLQVGKPQFSIYKQSFEIEFQQYVFTLPVRAKLDLLAKNYNISADFKTTACGTEKEFRNSIEFFDYDRQAALYMDLAGVDRHFIIGISKKTIRAKNQIIHPVYSYAIKRGDATYLRGKDKYSFLAFKWKTLISDFVVNEPIKI